MKKTAKIDLVKLLSYILKRAWIIVLCAELGFGLLYLNTTRTSDTYTTRGTLYISNGQYLTDEDGNYLTGPKQYVTATDLEAGEGLVNNYLTIIDNNRVISGVVENLKWDYPDITGYFIRSSLIVEPVAKTGVIVVKAVTSDPELSADMVNAVLEVAAERIVEVVGGEVEIVDQAVVRWYPDDKNGLKQGVLGGLAGAVAAVAVLFFIFLLNSKVTDENDLIEHYTPPVLGTVQAIKHTDGDGAKPFLSEQIPPEILGDYEQLQVRLLHILEEKKGKSVVITSAAAEKGKSEVAAALAASCALDGLRVMLADCDFKENSQQKLFDLDQTGEGMADLLENGKTAPDLVVKNVVNGMDLIPAGRTEGVSAGLLRSAGMQRFLENASAEYDLVLLDMPGINTSADSLVVSKYVTGALFVTSRGISDHREIRKALISAEMSGMDVLGFVLSKNER